MSLSQEEHLLEANAIGVHELKTHTSRIVRAVQEERTEYVITVRGRPVAVLRPFTGDDAERLRQAKLDEALDEMKTLAQEVAEAWKSPQSGVDLVQEQRR
jgi:prevent-host-death family protein